MPHQPAMSLSISFHFPFNRAGGRTSNVRLVKHMYHIILNSGIFGSLALLSGMLGVIVGTLILILSVSRGIRVLAYSLSIIPLGLGILGTVVAYILHRDSFAATGLSNKVFWQEVLCPTLFGGFVSILVLIVIVVVALLGKLFHRSRAGRHREQAAEQDAASNGG